MSRSCPTCGCSELEEDPSRGDVVCTQCGAVLEESGIVSEVQFQERAGGHDVIGQFVSRDRAQQSGLVGVPGLAKTESREITHQRGKKLINEIGSQLRISSHNIETAFNFFKMAVSRNFTRGRPRVYVVASCLYMACRIQGTSHLLLDFSDTTQVNVYELGRTLSLLTELLNIRLPQTDPCLYVLRFALMLEFGDQQKKVVTLATRIVQRMKTDWIATGRRPTGLCGAALLLAARAHGFTRTVGDIVKVVHISDTVVRKRLDEFAATPSGGLTVEDFQSIELAHEEDPPAFQEARRRARDEHNKEEEQAQQLTKDVLPLTQKVNAGIKEKFQKSSLARELSKNVNDVVPEIDEASAGLVRGDILSTVYDIAEDELYDEPQSTNYYMGPTAESLGISRQHQVVAEKFQTAEEILNDNDFGDISDGEIDSYILSESEARNKQVIWIKRNGAIMEELERKRKERKEEEERRLNDPTKKKRNMVTKKEPINAANHQDAMKHIIKEKNLSSKINYDVLAELENVEEILEERPRQLPKKCPEPVVEELVASTSSASDVSMNSETLSPAAALLKKPQKKTSSMCMNLLSANTSRIQRERKRAAEETPTLGTSKAASPVKSPPPAKKQKSDVEASGNEAVAAKKASVSPSKENSTKTPQTPAVATRSRRIPRTAAAKKVAKR